jgi:hypothetical protein
VEVHAKNLGIKQILLDVYLNNEVSQKFHEARGYKPFVQIFSKQVTRAFVDGGTVRFSNGCS